MKTPWSVRQLVAGARLPRHTEARLQRETVEPAGLDLVDVAPLLPQLAGPQGSIIGGAAFSVWAAHVLHARVPVDDVDVTGPPEQAVHAQQALGGTLSTWTPGRSWSATYARACAQLLLGRTLHVPRLDTRDVAGFGLVLARLDVPCRERVLRVDFGLSGAVHAGEIGRTIVEVHGVAVPVASLRYLFLDARALVLHHLARQDAPDADERSRARQKLPRLEARMAALLQMLERVEPDAPDRDSTTLTARVGRKLEAWLGRDYDRLAEHEEQRKHGG